MNKKTEKKLTRQKQICEYNLAKRKKTEREISKMEREVEKIQNFTPQVIRESNKKELDRVAISKTPKNKSDIADVKSYRKQRAKNRGK